MKVLAFLMNCKNFFVNILKKVIKIFKVFRPEICVFINDYSKFLNNSKSQ